MRGAQRVLPGVIAGETLLRVGSEYSEEDVRAGVTRFARLPFLAAADYSLEDGSDAAHRVVVGEGGPSVFISRRWPLLFDETTTLLDHDYDFTDPTME